MKITFIGAGRLATNLSRALLDAGHDIIQVYSRTMESAQKMATLAGGAATNDIKSLRNDADVYIVALKDSCVAELLPLLCKGKEQKVIIHTAGSLPMEIFKGMALHYGVLYPMQTFSKEKIVDFKNIPCFLEGNDELSRRTIASLASSISEFLFALSSDDRKYLHLASVFACNFANHCYTIAADILAKHNIPFDVMIPLVDETAQKVHELPPAEAQTGPAMRFDENVLRQQSQLLKDNPLAKEIYDRMSVSIHNRKLKSEKS